MPPARFATYHSETLATRRRPSGRISRFARRAAARLLLVEGWGSTNDDVTLGPCLLGGIGGTRAAPLEIERDLNLIEVIREVPSGEGGHFPDISHFSGSLFRKATCCQRISAITLVLAVRLQKKWSADERCLFTPRFPDMNDSLWDPQVLILVLLAAALALILWTFYEKGSPEEQRKVRLYIGMCSRQCVRMERKRLLRERLREYEGNQ